MPTSTLTRSQFDLIDETIQRQARSVVTEIGDAEPETLIIRTHGHDIRLPSELARFLIAITEQTSTGSAVRVQRLPEDLTTTTAAELLGMSRPTLMKLVHSKVIPSHKVGTHTRVKTTDLLSYKRERQASRRRELQKLLALEAEFGDED